MFREAARIACISLCASVAFAIDVTHAVVVAPGNLTGPERKAVEMLVDEVAARSQVRWQLASRPPSGNVPVVTIARKQGIAGPEGYGIRTAGTHLTITGDDARGVLFGIGRLLRGLEFSRGHVE